MNDKPITQSSDSDLRNSHAAMLRAAHRAREVARQTGTRLVVIVEGKVRCVHPDEPSVAEPNAGYGEHNE